MLSGLSRCYAAYQIAIQNGWLPQDDVRALEDLNLIPGGVNTRRTTSPRPIKTPGVPIQHLEDKVGKRTSKVDSLQNQVQIAGAG